jgi:predicted secreted protein
MMTNEQFIAEAKRRGKSKEETFAKYKELESKGVFDSHQPEQPQPQSQQKKQGVISGIEERQRNQAERLLAPTTLGSMANRALNLNPKSVAGQTVEQIAGIPETTARNLSGIFETAGEPVGALVQLAGSGINKLLGGAPGRLAEKGVSKIIEQPAVQKGYKSLADIYKQMPESEKANLASIPGLIEGATMGPGGGSLANLGKNQFEKQAIKQVTKNIPNQIDDVIETGISKGVKPTVYGKKTLPRRDAFYDKAKDAVKTISDEGNNIKIIDIDGNIVKSPRNNAEFAQAIEQAKNNIYKRYHKMALDAGEGGAKIDISPAINEIVDMSRDINLPPDARRYAAKLFDEISELNGATPDVIENRMKDLNSSLMTYFKGTRTDQATAKIDAKVASKLREQLDKSITEATGPGYKELKKKYGSLKAIEDEVNKRAVVQARRANKSIADLTDVFTVPEIATGILSSNPALIVKGVAGKGIKELYKTLNDPDRAIKTMFKELSKLNKKSAKLVDRIRR